MLIELIIFLLAGTLTGAITGLVPGIHINLIGTILVSLSFSVIYIFSPIYLAVFIVSMAITHTFLDFIPSVFLGCPDTDTELSVLPGHDFLKKGKAHTAIMLSTYGSASAIITLLIISIPSLILIPKFYELIKPAIPYIIALVSISLIISEKSKLKALFAFTLAGILGILFLNLETIKISEPLLPLLTGLFGASSIILSIKNKTNIPKQKIKKIKFPSIKPLLGASVAAPLCSFFPGLGSGQAAIIGSSISKLKTDSRGFLFLLGATNTLVMGFSILSLYAISRTRTGAASALSQILKEMTPQVLTVLIITIAISGAIAFFLTTFISSKASKKINFINYKTLSYTTLTILTTIVLFVSGIKGIILLALSTATGIYIILLKVRRTNMMGALLIPTILFYLL